MSWEGLEKQKDGTELPRLARLQLEVETVLIGLQSTEGWSSRVQADKIVDLVAKTVLGQRTPEMTQPWLGMNCEDPESVWEQIDAVS